METRMKLLIAYDGSSSADTALGDLARAGLPSDTSATVISVADVFVPQVEASETFEPETAFIGRTSKEIARRQAQVSQALEEARRSAAKAREQLRLTFPNWEVHTEACGHSPAWAIIKKTDEWKPHLVVLGSHNRSALGRLFLGSVSQTVLTETHCSVRIARERLAKEPSPLRIVIGVDGSSGSALTVTEVASRAWPPGTQVYLVAVWDRAMSTALHATEESFQDEQAWVKGLLQTSTEKLQPCGLSVSEMIQKGDPKEVLVREAERLQADCIFLGARGLRRIQRFLLGSVSTAVAARAPCSVEIVRPPQTTEQ